MPLKQVKNEVMLYLGHQHRCKNQEDRIAEVFEDLSNHPLKFNLVILVDYKTKLEPIRYREKTTEFFGKKGISWH